MAMQMPAVMESSRSRPGPATGGNVLVVVENAALRATIVAHLQRVGHIALPVADATEACRLIHEMRPDAVLLDHDTPSAADPELRALLCDGPERERIPLALLGADARTVPPALAHRLFIAKPYRPRDLAEQLDQLLQSEATRGRDTLPPAGHVRVGLLELDFARRAVTVLGRHPARWVDLAPAELRLLRFLMEQPDRTLSRADIVHGVWGPGVTVDERTVDQWVRRLREALVPIQADVLVKTVRGLGYRIETSVLPADEPALGR